MIFISYSRKDKENIKEITSDLEILGKKIWFDSELSGGQRWWDKILSSIRTADVFIFILSKNSINSHACKQEYQYAASLEKPILPVLISGNITPDKLPPALSELQLVDYQVKIN